ncbi:ferredoxin--NADP reductase [Alkalimonas mucilaginosa]|uniref:ferredoxin--NADP(+) reductase n=1 Tax=Alkalimonas mucilaginosa TaxID=3057676 RepID=A0ABU7JGJ4_9GAMM|nr:ferredoxin--NADP reductase [Alkalimonas sp. MEB004]MEE2024814.1 ferredoxin--NADP reductase [Alkalimonas sp. MEB004]
MRGTITETVTQVHHWNDTLFSIKTTRRPGFTFENGQFVMIGIEVDNKPLLRAYSIASANYEDELEFFSIKVPDGALTSRLQHIQVGQSLHISTRPTGTLVAGHLTPGENLYLLATGTGLAPFMSIIKDPAIYEQFNKVILVHGVRTVSELAYQDVICNQLPNNEFFGDWVRDQLLYHPTVTREAYRHALHQQRITSLLQSDIFTEHLGMPPLSPERDRFMLCGNQAMLDDTMAILNARGFSKANSRQRGDYVIEQAFLEK